MIAQIQSTEVCEGLKVTFAPGVYPQGACAAMWGLDNQILGME